jgi:hypothetical protein
MTSKILRGMCPFIVCEILPRHREHQNERTRQVVESLNYAPYWITPSGYIRVSRFDSDDCVLSTPAQSPVNPCATMNPIHSSSTCP